MNTRRHIAGSLALPFILSVALAQPQPLPVIDDKPTPQVDAGGPSAAVTALAFGDDGKTLYAAGLDKVVRVWTLEQNGKFAVKMTYRVPVGPGNAGAVNAVALSPDGAWVAFAGRAPIRGEAGFRQTGTIVTAAALSRAQYEDAGVIYVASTANPAAGKVLRGHRGEVRALAFAPGKGKLLLVSAATERTGAKHFGGLRLWDVEKGELLKERPDMPALNEDSRPGLAVARAGPEGQTVRVAVVWPEKQPKEQPFVPDHLRVWEADTGVLTEWPSDLFTRTAVLLPQNGKILTGGFDWSEGIKPKGKPPAGGRLREWDLGKKLISTVVDFPPRNGVFFLPQSLSVVLDDNGVPRHAAVVLKPDNDALKNGASYRLNMINLKNSRVDADIALADSHKDWQPTIASRGKYLAIAASRDHSVHVYAVADLLNKKEKAQPQVLRGAGLALSRIAFVDNGRGLWLSENGKAQALAGGWVFDFDKRDVRANKLPKLADDTPNLGPWRCAIDEDKKGVKIWQGQKQMAGVRLPGDKVVVTRWALRPAGQGLPDVLAVAYTETDASKTVIMLCNPADGKPYRHLISHLQDVHDLAFSASRPLLASVADDQTLCVWSLKDLDNAVGKVAGLGVENEEGKEGNKVVISHVEPGSPAAKAMLAKGDVVEKLGVPGAVAKTVKDAVDFELSVSARKPGDEVEVTVRGKGAMKLPVERGVDFRNPLFSLFLLSNLEWVGFSPAGPYDFSDVAAEAHLGWHTNTGDAATPVSYAAAGAYRKDYHRKGILGYLAENADLGNALKKWDSDNPPPPPVQPALRLLRPDEAQPAERDDTLLVRQPVKFLRAAINEDYALDKQILLWRFTRADGEFVNAQDKEISGVATRDGKEWQIGLPGLNWRRGEYLVQVGLHVDAKAPKLASDKLTLRFQSPAPVVALWREDGKPVPLTTEAEPLPIEDQKLALQVVLTAPAGQKVKLLFTQNWNGRPQDDVPPPRDQAGNGKFKSIFTLKEGLNRLAIQAVNEGALAGHEDKEKAIAEMWVTYKAPKELPPRFTALQLQTQSELKSLEVQRRNGKEVKKEIKEVRVVSLPDPVLTGKVEAKGVLDKVQWTLDNGNFEPILGSQGEQLGPNGGKFSIKLKGLVAGKPVPVRLRANTKNSAENTAELWVVLQPPLPIVSIDPLDSQDFLKDTVTLKGTVKAAVPQKFQVLFQVTSSNGTVETKLEKVGTWDMELKLFPGINTVKVFVENEWRGKQALGGDLKLRYLQPPTIAALPKVEAIGTNKVNLTLTVEGPAGWDLTAIKVNKNPVPMVAGKPKQIGSRWEWKVELPEVFVNDGQHDLHELKFQAVTDQGESKEMVVAVDHKALPRHPPRARFVTDLPTDTARRPEYAVSIRVESEHPLEKVEIRREDKVLHEVSPADLKKMLREGKLNVLQEDLKLILMPGVNTLELVAVNKDGRSPRAELVVGYTEAAVLINIDQIECEANGKQPLKPAYHSNGEVTFPMAEDSFAWLVGQVRWSDPKAKALDEQDLKVIVKVGDCRQFPVEFKPRGAGNEANIRKFRVPMVLIGNKNKIKIEVTSVAQQELSRREFELACAKPAANQRLHVLIVGVDVQDENELKKRVLDALGVDAQQRPKGAQGGFTRNPPFDTCNLYRVLAGYVDAGLIRRELLAINDEIRKLKDAKGGWLNDIVLIYYQGEDWEPSGKNERWLKTSENFEFPKSPVETFAIRCNDLARVPGVPLLLLNVTGKQNADAARPGWGGDPDGVMRYALDSPQARKDPNPALFGRLEKATQQKNLLGDVLKIVNYQLDPRPLVVFDSDQENRQISAKNERKEKP